IRASSTSNAVGAIRDSVRNPWAIVPPKELSSAARSASTWINWGWPVQWANSSMRAWSSVVHEEAPISSPTCFARSPTGMMLSAIASHPLASTGTHRESYQGAMGVSEVAWRQGLWTAPCYIALQNLCGFIMTYTIAKCHEKKSCEAILMEQYIHLALHTNRRRILSPPPNFAPPQELT